MDRTGAVLGRCDSRMVVAVLVVVCVAALTMCASAVASGPISWRAPMVIDHPPPYTFPAVPHAVSCPTQSFCALVGRGDVMTSTNPTGGLPAWGVTQIESGQQYSDPIAISCPSVALCIAVDDGGNVFSSTDPRGGAAAWKRAHVDGGVGPASVGFASVSCPTALLCVAVDTGGNVVSSTDPTGGARAWRITRVESSGLTVVSCISGTLCVAVDRAGHVITSTNPMAGRGGWTISAVDQRPLLTLSCASATLCVAGDDSGNVVSSANPVGGAGAWSLAHVDTAIAQCTDPTDMHPCQSWLSSVSCPSQSLCVAGDNLASAVLTSSNPTGGASAWSYSGRRERAARAVVPGGLPVRRRRIRGRRHLHRPDGWRGHVDGGAGRSHRPSDRVSCPSASLCVATDVADRVLVSRDPTAPDPVWSVATLPSPYGLRDVTCTAPSLCVGVAGRDQVLTSTDPAGGASAWADTNLPSTISALPIVSGVSCPSVALCAAVNDWGDVFVSRNPTSRAPAWTKFRAASQSIDPGVDGISCPSVSLCVAVADGATVGNGGEIITSTTVAAAHPAWRVTHFDRIRGLDSVSCPSISLCVATDADDGSFFVSTHPTGGASSWKMVTVSGFHPDSVSCATPSLCVAINEFTSSAIASADPSGGAASWSAAQIDINFLGRAEISCNGSFCIVGDDVGAAVLGFPAPTPTPAQLRKALRKQLVPSGRPAALLTHGGYPYSFRIPAPGRLTVSWYTTTARSVLARQRSRPTLIATASAYIAADTTDRIKLRLTREGRRLIRRGPRLPVTAEALFTTAQHTLVARSNFTLSPAGA